MNRPHAHLLALLPLAAPASVAAQLHSSDIILVIDQAAVATRRVDAGGGAPTIVPERVFAGDFLGGASTSDPGFDCVPFTFAVGSRTGFDFTRRLAKWSPASLAFAPVDSPVLRARLGSLSTFTPATDTTTPGIGLTINADGTYHRHYTFALFADRGNPGSGIAPTPVPADETGTYLLSMQVWNTTPGIAPSSEVYIVLARSAPAGQQAQAVQWVRDNLLATGPAPCSPADIAATDGSAGPDGSVDNGDFQAFFSSFFAGCQTPALVPCALADIAATDGSPGPDGNIDNGDFQAFFSSFFSQPCA